MENYTIAFDFYILGFTIEDNTRVFFVLLFIIVYIVTSFSNAAIICIVKKDKSLHTPMYFFLAIFSFFEICYISVIFPTIIKVMALHVTHILFSCCITQLFLFLSFACTENFMLAAMAFDRYVAVCEPLRYMTIMNNNMCMKMAFGSWAVGFITPIIPVFMISKLIFCGSHEIDHFFCDLVPLMRLACHDVSFTELISTMFASTVLLSSCGVTTLSYIHITIAACKMSTSQNLQKMLTTCTSQLVIVVTFYTSGIFSYVFLAFCPYITFQKQVSLLYTVVTPLINPFIYTLKNKDVKVAIRKMLFDCYIRNN